jgi:hypothetical protein
MRLSLENMATAGGTIFTCGSQDLFWPWETEFQFSFVECRTGNKRKQSDCSTLLKFCAIFRQKDDLRHKNV